VPPHVRGQPVGVLLELPAQPGLAHPGRAGYQHQRRLQAVHPLRAARDALRQHVHEYLSGAGRGLHPRRGVHRIPGDRALAHSAHRDRDLAGHHPGARREPRQAGFDPELSHRGHQVQRRPHRPFGIFFAGYRGAPHRHHRVADELLHHPAVPVGHRPRHPEILREQLAHRLRIPCLRQRGETDQITEQHGAHPPLRHRPLGPRRGYRYGRRTLGQRVPARMAEPVPRDSRLTARRAASCRGTAVPAESVALPNGRTALRAPVHPAVIPWARRPVHGPASGWHQAASTAVRKKD
jgi:hypothetical protein